MRLSRSIRRMLLAIALVMQSSAAALGMAVTEWIEDPLPVEYRDRVADLLKKVRPKDAERSLEGVKALFFSGRSRGGTYIIMRVEADCQEHLCMTLVGRVESGSIDLDLVLVAGPSVIFGDFIPHLWGATIGPPLTFEASRNAGVVAALREQGWVLSACADCAGHATKPPPPPPRSPARKVDTVEELARALEEGRLNR